VDECPHLLQASGKPLDSAPAFASAHMRTRGMSLECWVWMRHEFCRFEWAKPLLSLLRAFTLARVAVCKSPLPPFSLPYLKHCSQPAQENNWNVKRSSMPA